MNHEEENMNPGDDPGQFGLPQGYFQQSGALLRNKLEWLEEHRHFPRLMQLSGTNGFSVPEHYFSQSESRLEVLDLPALSALKKQQPFSVPENYFEALDAEKLLQAVQEKKSLLDAIPKQNNFKVSDTYFEANEQKLQELLLKEKKAARIITFPAFPKFPTLGKLRQTWLAAAALLVLALGVWIYTASNKPVPSAQNGDCGTVACLDKKDLLKSKTIENLETDDLYDLVSPKQLEKKLESKTAKGQVDKKTDSSQDNGLDDDLLPDEI